MDVHYLNPGDSKGGKEPGHSPEITGGEGDIDLGGHLHEPLPMIGKRCFDNPVDITKVEIPVRIREVSHSGLIHLIGFSVMLQQRTGVYNLQRVTRAVWYKAPPRRIASITGHPREKRILEKSGVFHFLEGLFRKVLHTCGDPGR